MYVELNDTQRVWKLEINFFIFITYRSVTIVANDTTTKTIIELTRLVGKSIEMSEDIENHFTIKTSYNVSEAALSKLNQSVASLSNIVKNQSIELRIFEESLDAFQGMVISQNENATRLVAEYDTISTTHNVLYSNDSALTALFELLEQKLKNVNEQSLAIQVSCINF